MWVHRVQRNRIGKASPSFSWSRLRIHLLLHEPKYECCGIRVIDNTDVVILQPDFYALVVHFERSHLLVWVRTWRIFMASRARTIATCTCRFNIEWYSITIHTFVSCFNVIFSRKFACEHCQFVTEKKHDFLQHQKLKHGVKLAVYAGQLSSEREAMAASASLEAKEKDKNVICRNTSCVHIAKLVHLKFIVDWGAGKKRRGRRYWRKWAQMSEVQLCVCDDTTPFVILCWLLQFSLLLMKFNSASNVYRCATKVGLGRHIHYKHSTQESRAIYECNECSFSTMNNTHYTRHLLKHKSVVLVCELSRPFVEQGNESIVATN